MSTSAITLFEWETRGPDRGSPLAGRSLDESSRKLAKCLKEQGSMEVLELARGLEIRATSFIGRVKLGDLTITVRPKLRGAPFLSLLRYSYDLRDLHLHHRTGYESEKWAFQELLIQQLADEIRELLARGVHREYERVEADLTMPTGRIQFHRLASVQYSSRSVIPCIHYPRTEDTLLNQVLLAGLIFAVSLTTDAELRTNVGFLIKTLSLTVSRQKLSSVLLTEGYQNIDRRTTPYRPALRLIQILLQAEGVSLEVETNRLRVPGFLFDMNRFFQALVSRYLHDHLLGYEVKDEFHLDSLFLYAIGGNPLGRKAPVQRPDFVVSKNGRIAAILDAKYRDLWENSLPREMLYQLALYSLAHPAKQKKSVILYPTLATAPSDQVIQLRAFASGATQAHVILRPLKLLQLEELLRCKGLQAGKRKTAFAHQLLFGSLLK